MKNIELQILFFLSGNINNLPEWIADTSVENDNDSGELIIDLKDGRSFAISTKDIKEVVE